VAVTVFYDGECPFCTRYVRLLRLRRAAGTVRLVDLRADAGIRSALEGEGFDGRMVILEFPDKASAEAWYADPEYAQARTFRHAASTAKLFVLQEGGRGA